MKHALKAIVIAVLAGLFFAGCTSATSNSHPTSSITSAPPLALSAAMASLSSSESGAMAADGGQSVPGITTTGSGTMQDGNFSYTISYTDYDDGSGNILNGQIVSTATFDGTTLIFEASGTLVVTGGGQDTTVSLSLHMKTTETTTTIDASFTIDGNTYSYSATGGNIFSDSKAAPKSAALALHH